MINTFLLVWNPKRWQWKDLGVLKTRLDNGGVITRDWSCGNTKKISVGDRVYIIRLGLGPKGIFASGIVEKERHLGSHWDPEEKRQIYYVTISFDKLLNPESEKVLYREELENKDFQPMHWDSQMSGIQIPADVADQLEMAWNKL